jgi:hypothetical protein
LPWYSLNPTASEKPSKQIQHVFLFS